MRRVLKQVCIVLLCCTVFLLEGCRETQASLELWVISSADGSVLQSNGIQDIFEFPEQAAVKSMTVDSEDNIYISDGSSSVYVIDKTGKAQCMISSDAWIGKLFTSKFPDKCERNFI